MKPITTTVFILFSLLTCFAQNPTTKSLEKFTEVKVYDRITVTLIKSHENKLTLIGDNTDDVEVLESNGILKLKRTENQYVSSTMAAIKLYYTEELTVIDANENARIVSNNSINGSSLEIRAQEASIITLNVDATTVITKSNSGSEIKLSGTTEIQDATINTGGKIHNKGLKSKNTTVAVLAGGYAEIYATEKAVAKVKAGGTIVIYGNPKIIDKGDNFGGTIKVIE